MRHLRSILYALILAPAAWILCGVGFDQDLTGRARDNGGLESVGGLLLLLLAGAAYGILLFAPISPSGPLLTGLTFLGVGAWARVSPSSYASVWPADVTKDGFNVSTPGYGLALLLAVPLVCTALSARRWAGYEPPQVVLIGTLGRARGAATAPGMPMAAEPTTVFAPAPAVPHQRRPADDEEKTTLLAALFPDEPTRDVAASEERTTVLAPVTAEISADGEKTQVIRAEIPGDRTQVLGIPGGTAADEKTTVLAPVAEAVTAPANGAATALKPTNSAPTASKPAAAASSPAAAASNSAAAASKPAGEETTKSMSILGEERPDPAQDPTTRLTAVAAQEETPGEAKTQASKTSTVANLERPADEAADDTRPLTLPAPPHPTDDETTRLL
ncbi:hypothetical protein AB0368_10480 [Actinoplanes sp. NPDC051475]|uniref:hypothetical protein n=1 Tax=Actinoplanes sp. NPDC051475 TaxID=3157225 RepID=UPI0034510A69